MTDQASDYAKSTLSTTSQDPSGKPDEQQQQQQEQGSHGLKPSPAATKLTSVDPRQEERRPSIQFSTFHSERLLRTESPRPSRVKASQRLSSPPPPSVYESRVSFDTFDNKDATDFSFTLRSKHRNYAYTRRSRTFLCGTDQNDYSEFALEWLLDELVDDGDEVVCLRVVDKDSKFSSTEEGKYRTEAHRLLEQIQSKTKDEEKSISLVLEFCVGKVQESIQNMIKIYEPACLIVGTRGRSLNGIQGLLPGSVSKYCLQNSPVPVIVVRPSSKREKKKRKRRADPTRRAYVDLLAQTGAGAGSNVFNRIETERALGEVSAAESQREAEAVARAIGMPTEYSASTILRKKSSRASEAAEGSEIGEGAPLAKTLSGRSDYTSGPDSPSPTGGLSPDMSLMDEGRSEGGEELPSPEIEADDEREDEEGDAGGGNTRAEGEEMAKTGENGKEDDAATSTAAVPELRIGGDAL